MARRRIRTLTEAQKRTVCEKTLIRLVDDDDSLRSALKFVLEIEGWQTADYADAKSFLCADSPSVPGCVVMDVKMPGITGIDALNMMNERGLTLPVIFITGHGDIDMAVMALHEGAVDFIQKPVDNERLLAVIASAAFESLAASSGLPDGAEAARRIALLTAREREMALLIGQGLLTREAAERLSISLRTAEVHRAAALRKLGLREASDIPALFELAGENR